MRRDNKKGFIIDTFYIGLMLVFIAIVGIIGYKIMKETHQSMTEGGIMDEEYTDYVGNYENAMPKMIDQIFIIALLGMSVVTLVSSFFVPSHPVLYFISVIILGLLSWINAIFSNIYYEIATTDALATEATQFMIIPYVMQYYPLIIIVISILIAVVMTAKGGD